MVSYVAFGLSIFVHLSSFGCLGRVVRRSCGIIWISSLETDEIHMVFFRSVSVIFGIGPHYSFPTDHSKAVPLMQFLFVCAIQGFIYILSVFVPHLCLSWCL